MEDKEMNELNDEMGLPEDGSQTGSEPASEPLEAEFDAVGDEMEEDFDQFGEDLEERFEQVGEKIEQKMENFGEEMEKVGERIGAAFEEAFGELEPDEENIHIHVDKSGKTVHKHVRRGGQTVFWGLAMIAVGVAVILSQLGIFSEDFNWWAIFILVPGFGFLSGALDNLIVKGRISSSVRSLFGTGLLVLTVGGMFLFDLNWGDFWPLILIVVGFSMFLNGFAGKKDYKSVVGRWFNRYGLWTGLAVLGLGAAFLLRTLDVFSMSSWYKEWALQFTSVTDGWWGLFLLLPGIGGLLHALIIILTAKRFPFPAILLAVSGIACLSVGIVAAMGLKWSLITPLVVIGAGLIIVMGEFLHQIVKDRKVHRVRGENEVEGKVVED